VATGAAIAQAVVLVGLTVLLPAAGVPLGWIDRIGFVAIAALAAFVLTKFARLRAEPGERTLVVQNFVYRTELEWAQIVAVRFGGGDPWATLDLDDGDTLAVMAIQRADGERGAAEAQRLATLVAEHTRTPRDE
jgi:hypothetical protein